GFGDEVFRWIFPKLRHSIVAVAIAVVIGIELDLPIIAIEVQVRHVRPRLVTGDILYLCPSRSHWK
ncbi:MAG: hypothetical protein U1C57_01820, partial [Candidatus Doudnabacteria bacterium]|nr:hypothetical protein [Candidatus Doudnabacteria bacterium]